jgi:hypothetical protein
MAIKEITLKCNFSFRLQIFKFVTIGKYYIFIAVLSQINCNKFSCVEGVWLFKIFILFFNVSSISDQSFADVSSSNITRLPPFMPMLCPEFN